MKTEEKRTIMIIIIIGIIIIGGILLLKKTNQKEATKQEENTVLAQTEKYVEVLTDGTKLNTSNKLNQTKKLDGMEISQMQLTYKNGSSIILATVTNTTNQNIPLTPIILTLYNDKNEVIETVNGLISPMKPRESVQLNMGTSVDYANAYDFKIEKK